MKATLLLRRQHRNIEQALALLESVCDLQASDFLALEADLLAHLLAEETFLYPAAERAVVHDLATHRVRHARVRAAVVEAARRVDDRASFRAAIGELTAAFATHARLEERAIHATLETTLSDASLEDLGHKVSVFRVERADRVVRMPARRVLSVSEM